MAGAIAKAGVFAAAIPAVAKDRDITASIRQMGATCPESFDCSEAWRGGGESASVRRSGMGSGHGPDASAARATFPDS